MTETNILPEVIEAPVSGYDAFSLETLHDVHTFDGEQREIAPVVYMEKYGYYAITRYAEIQKALRDWRTFSSTDRPFYAPSAFRPRTLILEDPPEHTASKSAVFKVFDAENLAKMSAYFKAEAERLIDNLLADGPAEINAYHDLSVKYVLKVFPDVLGLPEEGRELLLKFGRHQRPARPANCRRRRQRHRAMEWANPTPAGRRPRWYRLAAYPWRTRARSPSTAQQILKSFLAGFDTTTASIASMTAPSRRPGSGRSSARSPASWTTHGGGHPVLPGSRYGGRWATRRRWGVRSEGAKILTMWLAPGATRASTTPGQFRVDRDLKRSPVLRVRDPHVRRQPGGPARSPHPPARHGGADREDRAHRRTAQDRQLPGLRT
jgi:hypothetical protein